MGITAVSKHLLKEGLICSPCLDVTGRFKEEWESEGRYENKGKRSICIGSINRPHSLLGISDGWGHSMLGFVVPELRCIGLVAGADNVRALGTKNLTYVSGRLDG